MKKRRFTPTTEDQAEIQQTIEAIQNPIARWFMRALAAAADFITKTFTWWLITAIAMVALIGLLASGRLDGVVYWVR